MAYWPSRSVLRVRVGGQPVAARAAAAPRVIVPAKAVRRDGPQLLGPPPAEFVSAGLSPSHLPPAPRPVPAADLSCGPALLGERHRPGRLARRVSAGDSTLKHVHFLGSVEIPDIEGEANAIPPEITGRTSRQASRP